MSQLSGTNVRSDQVLPWTVNARTASRVRGFKAVQMQVLCNLAGVTSGKRRMKRRKEEEKGKE